MRYCDPQLVYIETMNDDNKIFHDEYKQILITANKLESIQCKLESVIEFFIDPILKLCTKLCNDFLKLLFERQFCLNQFRKAEDLVWRRIYHDFYRVQKTKRQPIRESDEHLLNSYFMTGVGFYSCLIVRLRTQYKIYEVNNLIEPLSFPIGPLDNFIKNQRLNHGFENDATSDSRNDQAKSAAQQWAVHAIYRSLVHMGDLARYMIESSNHDFRQLSFKFYLAASRFQPDFGLPFNQLATLADGANHNLDAVCSYMRCISRSRSFEGAEENMRRLFELNSKLFHDMIVGQKVVSASEILASKNPDHDAETLIKSVIIIFVKLTSSIWQAISGEYNEVVQRNIIEETRIFFETLRESIDIDPIMPLPSSKIIDTRFSPLPGCSTRDDKPRYLSPTIMYEFSSIAIMLIARTQNKKNQSVSNNLVELLNTLALNLLYHATTKSQKMIINKLHDLRMLEAEHKSSMEILSEPNSKDILGTTSISSQRSLDNVNSSSDTSRRNLSRLRRKKAAANYSDGEMQLAPNNDPDMSELEDTALSTIDALDISSDMSDNDDSNDLIDLESSSNGDNRSSKLSRPAIRSTRSQNYESQRPRILLDTSTNSLPGPDLLTGDLEFHSVNYTKGPMPMYQVTARKKERQKESDGLGALESALSYIYLQTYLPTVKVLFDWLLSNLEVISSNVETFQNFSAELINTALLLDEITKIALRRDLNTDSSSSSPSKQHVCNSVYSHTFNNPDWIQKFPLSCDYPLINLGPLKTVHEINIDFNCPKLLSDSEAGHVTSQCILAFSHALSSFLTDRICKP